MTSADWVEIFVPDYSLSATLKHMFVDGGAGDGGGPPLNQHRINDAWMFFLCSSVVPSQFGNILDGLSWNVSYINYTFVMFRFIPLITTACGGKIDWWVCGGGSLQHQCRACNEYNITITLRYNGDSGFNSSFYRDFIGMFVHSGFNLWFYFCPLLHPFL